MYMQTDLVTATVEPHTQTRPQCQTQENEYLLNLVECPELLITPTHLDVDLLLACIEHVQWKHLRLCGG